MEPLHSMGVDFNCINLFSWANKGEKELLCPFLLSVGVTSGSLDYDDAVAAAVDVKAILAKSGLPEATSEAEVAFVEMVNKRLGCGPRLLTLDPIADSVSEYRKHFSSVLGLPIAPLGTAHLEGTGALYFRLGSDTKDIALLTCAHVIQPPLAFPDNKGLKRANRRQRKEYMVALGYGSYCRTNEDMMVEIAKLLREIEVWNLQLKRNLSATRHNQITIKVVMATDRINQLNAFHTEATRFRTIPVLRSIGWVLHSSPIQVSAQPLGYAEDWGLIQIDPKMIDEDTFLGNKVFVGTSFP